MARFRRDISRGSGSGLHGATLPKMPVLPQRRRISGPRKGCMVQPEAVIGIAILQECGNGEGRVSG